MNNNEINKTDNLISTLCDYIETMAKEDAEIYAIEIARVTNALTALITARANVKVTN